MTLSGTSGVFRKGASGFFFKHLPNRTKRLVFMASLTARLKGSDTFTDDTLRKLNTIMSLSNSDSAMKLPVHLSRVIWRGKGSYEIFNDNVDKSSLTQTQIKNAISRALDAMPAWLRYCDDAVIEKDVQCIIENRSIVL